MLSWLRTKRRPHPDEPGQEAAEQALEHEDRKLGAVHRQTRTIHSEAGALKRLGEENDFAGKLRRAMGGLG